MCFLEFYLKASRSFRRWIFSKTSNSFSTINLYLLFLQFVLVGAVGAIGAVVAFGAVVVVVVGPVAVVILVVGAVLMVVADSFVAYILYEIRMYFHRALLEEH